MSNPNPAELSMEELLTLAFDQQRAQALLETFNSLRSMVCASHEEFIEAGLNESDILEIQCILETSCRYAKQPRIEVISKPMDAYQVLAPLMEGLDQEVVRCILLNNQSRIISIPLITIGTLNSSLIHPRECFKEAVRKNASSLILAHQHPSGDPTPSEDDRHTTVRIKTAGEILGISVKDHIVIGSDERYFSFLEQGLI